MTKQQATKLLNEIAARYSGLLVATISEGSKGYQVHLLCIKARRACIVRSRYQWISIYEVWLRFGYLDYSPPRPRPHCLPLHLVNASPETNHVKAVQEKTRPHLHLVH